MPKKGQTPYRRILSALNEGDLDKAIELQQWHHVDLTNPRSGDFILAVRQCVEVRMLLPGMSPEEVVEKVRTLVGDLDIDEELALLGKPMTARQSKENHRWCETYWKDAPPSLFGVKREKPSED